MKEDSPFHKRLEERFEDARKVLEELLNPKEEIKKDKRLIIINDVLPKVKEHDMIYVALEPPKIQDIYSLELSSNKPFYFPFLNNPINRISSRKTYGISMLKGEEMVLDYLITLKEINESKIIWKDDKPYIAELKNKFQEKV